MVKMSPEMLVEYWKLYKSTKGISLATGIPRRTIQHYILKFKDESGLTLSGYTYKYPKYLNSDLFEPQDEESLSVEGLKKLVDTLSLKLLKLEKGESSTKEEIIKIKDNIYDFSKHPNKEIYWKVKDATVVCASDCHYYSEEAGPAHLALLDVISLLKPEVVLINGDAFEYKTISKHAPRFIDELRLSPKEETEIVKTRFKEIREAGGVKTVYQYVIGNHSQRIESYVLEKAPQLAQFGFSLKDIIPDWNPAMAVNINKNISGVVPTKFLHSWFTSQHAAYNNVLKSGCNIVTSHTHRLTYVNYTDETGKTRMGIETGFLGDSSDELFNYTNGSTKNWQAGFVVLHFKDYHLAGVEFVKQSGDGHFYFRGKKVG